MTDTEIQFLTHDLQEARRRFHVRHAMALESQHELLKSWKKHYRKAIKRENEAKIKHENRT